MFVHPIMKYSATAWSPHTILGISKLERVQRRAARYVFNDFSPFHSVSAMFNQLNWSSLRVRRDYLKVVLLYKLIKGLVIITPPPDLSLIAQVLHKVTQADCVFLLLELNVIYFLFYHLLSSSGIPCHRI